MRRIIEEEEWDDTECLEDDPLDDDEGEEDPDGDGWDWEDDDDGDPEEDLYWDEDEID